MSRVAFERLSLRGRTPFFFGKQINGFYIQDQDQDHPTLFLSVSFSNHPFFFCQGSLLLLHINTTTSTSFLMNIQLRFFYCICTQMKNHNFWVLVMQVYVVYMGSKTGEEDSVETLTQQHHQILAAVHTGK